MVEPQFHEDLQFIRRMWVVERAGWAFLALVLLAALLGAFGRGLLSEVRAAAADGSYTAVYNRFERMQSPVTLSLELADERSSSDGVVVWISSDYLDRMTVTRVTPEPARVSLGADRTVFSFSTTGGSAVGRVRFQLEADTPGSAAGELGVDAGPAVLLRQFFHP